MISTGRRMLLATGGLALAGLLSACGGDGDVTVTPQGSAGTCVQAGDASVCAGPSGAVAAGGGAVASAGSGGAGAQAGGGASVSAGSGGVEVSAGGSGISVGGSGVRNGSATGTVRTTGALQLDTAVSATCRTVGSIKEIEVPLPDAAALQIGLTSATIGEVTLTSGPATFAATWVADPGDTVAVTDSSVALRGLRLAGDAGEVVLNAEIGC